MLTPLIIYLLEDKVVTSPLTTGSSSMCQVYCSSLQQDTCSLHNCSKAEQCRVEEDLMHCMQVCLISLRNMGDTTEKNIDTDQLCFQDRG